MIATTDAYGFSFCYPAGDTAIGACLREHGEFSRIGSTLAAQLSRDATFIDVGANIGVFTLPVSRTARHVVAIEAHLGLAGLLERNIADNNISNIEVINAAAGAAVGIMDFPTPSLSEQLNFGSSGRMRAPMSSVPIVTLDTITSCDVRFVKIDVEGAESEVLKGASRLVSEHGAHWLVEVNSPAVVELFLAAGYRTFWFYDPFVTPMAPKKKWNDRYRGDMSVFAVPRGQGAPLGMVEAFLGDPPPTTTRGFEYLRAFGLSPRD